MRRRHVRHVHARRDEWVAVHRGGRPARGGGGCMVVLLALPGMLILAGGGVGRRPVAAALACARSRVYRPCRVDPGGVAGGPPGHDMRNNGRAAGHPGPGLECENDLYGRVIVGRKRT